MFFGDFISHSFLRRSLFDRFGNQPDRHVTNMHNFIPSIKQLAGQNPDILIVWLYGSRAKGNAHQYSDYDLAVAFKSFIKNDPLEKRLRSEYLSLDWQQALAFPTPVGMNRNTAYP
jgi:predicted nucleotidyltransferase